MANQENTSPVFADIASQLPKEYALIEFLGEGGHGIVIKALHKTLQQAVALKIIKADRSDETAKHIARMQNEARILAKLQHKNIVRVLQMGACLDGTPFLVCEFLDGITLEQYLKKHQHLSPRMIHDVFTQVLEALSCAHENSLLHRDIKPSNIMLLRDLETDTLEVKLLDFGIARDFETIDSLPLGLTRTIQISGSAPYMSPEQCKGEKIDQRSDLYSVACVLYECLSGQPPFSGETPMHTRYLQINEVATLPPDEKFAQTSSRAAVYKLVLEGLSKQREIRPQSAEEFKSRLHSAMPNARNKVSWTPRRNWKDKKVFSAILLLAVVVAVAFYFSKNWHQSRSSEIISRKEAGSGRTKTVPTLSKELKLKNLGDRFFVYRYAGTPDSMKAGLTLREDLIAFTKLLRPTYADLPMHYSALRQKALLETYMNFFDESKQTWAELLNYCKTPNNEISLEAIECYWRMAAIALLKNDYLAAEQLALKGIAIQKSAGQAGLSPIDIPALYEMRNQICTAECYTVLADVDNIRKDFSSEFHHRESAELARLEKERIDIQPEYYIKLLAAASKAKGIREAYRLANIRYQEYNKQAEDGPTEGELANSLSELGKWYFDHNYLAEAANCYSRAKKIFSTVEATDREAQRAILDQRLAELEKR